VQLSAGQQLCVVCHDVANGIHFGAITCEGCKVSFTAYYSTDFSKARQTKDKGPVLTVYMSQTCDQQAH